jgi:DNA mismatch endonuclease (patch repair protein)
MADIFTKEKRSDVMRAVKGRDTKPEKAVRSLLHVDGYRFSLCRKDLPGSPDIVLCKYRAVVFVHGCFWHRHEDCKAGCKEPKSNVDFWRKKFNRNVERDAENVAELKAKGWKVVVAWECELRNAEGLLRRLRKEIGKDASAAG